MLVVSKKLGESVWLGAEIQVKVLGVRGGIVRLGIEAPPAVEVLREAPSSGDESATTTALPQAATA